ncbi:MAG: HPP family protein [Rhodospirillum sp.]|nr:HPP family protein [Rhodospirillum sp.]MCF8488706.1 HPP family protein [Rhodospirillum sp.]MCF8502169.1 HPP family protein [Rhodospirillum sp.]
MLDFLKSKSASLVPLSAGGHLGWLRGVIGAFLGIGLSGGVTLLALGTSDGALPWLVAPLGASAVLVFSVPASPLAQPWSVIGGDLISAAIGLGVGQFLGDPLSSGAVAVALAIALMSLSRCLHPPGGACALLCALGATGPAHWGWATLVPIGANVLTLVGVGWFYNNLTGHPWPHRAVAPPHPAPGLEDYTREDVEGVLLDWNEVLDIDVDDLDALFQALTRRVARRVAEERSVKDGKRVRGNAA